MAAIFDGVVKKSAIPLGRVYQRGTLSQRSEQNYDETGSQDEWLVLGVKVLKLHQRTSSVARHGATISSSLRMSSVSTTAMRDRMMMPTNMSGSR